MLNEKVIVYSENPEEDLWKKLLQFTYKSQIEKYFSKNGIALESDPNDIYEVISSSFLQASEYSALARNASLQTAPLLLYYGAINLLMGTISLVTGKVFLISNHGMKASPDISKTDIGSTKIHFSSPLDGGVHIFLRELQKESINLPELNDWTVEELLLSIPEINLEANKCYDNYESYCYEIKTILTENGQIEKVSFSTNDHEKIRQIFKEIPDFSKSYLPYVLSNEDDCTVATIRHKFLHEPIDLKACSGQSFLQRGHLKKGQLVILPQWATILIVLFALSALCRYRPQKWNPFLRLDTSGEKLLIEKFLVHARRILPNMLLSRIENRDYSFENRKYEPENRINILGEHEIKDLIQSLVGNRGSLNEEI